MRSLSPALQVIQRNLLTPDAPRVPDAPRGERPREYLSALSGAAHLLDYNPLTSPSSGASPEVLRASSPWLVSRPGSMQSTNPQPLSPPGVGCTSGTARKARPATADVRMDTVRKMPLSARTSRPSSEIASMWPTDRRSTLYDASQEDSVRKMPMSARTSRPSSDMSSIWPVARRRTMVDAFAEDMPRQESRKQGGMSNLKSQTLAKDADMDALDGLLASLADERAEKEEENDEFPDSPKPKPRAIIQRSPQTKSCSSSKSKYKATGKFRLTYDEEMVATSPNNSRSAGDLFQTQASIYCPLTPTIMSVQLPGTPKPMEASLPVPEFDASSSSVVLIGEPPKSDRSHYRAQSRPCRVRFECRGDADGMKHMPEAPQRKRPGTGRVTSRPLGCTLVANMGGA